MGSQSSKSSKRKENEASQISSAAQSSSASSSPVGLPVVTTAASRQSRGHAVGPAHDFRSPGQVPQSSPMPSHGSSSRHQQELDDEALARRMVMEEIAALGGGGSVASSQSAGFANVRGCCGTGQVQNQTARAQCPFCNAQNEFEASPGAAPVMMQCGACTRQFQVAMPSASSSSSSPSSSSGRMSLQLCRRCGSMNQFPTPALGCPMPDVLCGFCGSISSGQRRNLGGRLRSSEPRLLEQMLLEGQPGRGRAGSGPMVRVNVGGQRRLVPLALLLALMAEEADKSNPAQQDDIAALPTRRLKGAENLGEQKRCLVCLEDFGDGDDLKTLPCLHIYHQKCIEQWLHTDNSCPVCKTPIGELARAT